MGLRWKKQRHAGGQGWAPRTRERRQPGSDARERAMPASGASPGCGLWLGQLHKDKHREVERFTGARAISLQTSSLASQLAMIKPRSEEPHSGLSLV